MHFAHVRKFDRSIGRKRTASKVLGWFPKTQRQLMGSVTKLENPSSFRGSGWNIWYPHPIINYPLHRLKNGRWKVLPTCKSVLVIEATSWAEVQQWFGKRICVRELPQSLLFWRWSRLSTRPLKRWIDDATYSHHHNHGWVNGVGKKEKGDLVDRITIITILSYLVFELISMIRAVGRRFVTVGSNLKNIGN